MTDDEQNTRRGFWGPNARPFLVQSIVLIVLALLVGAFIMDPVSEYVCIEWDFCTTEERQRLGR